MAGYFWVERAAVWSIALVIVAPVCLIVFVISYMFNEKKAEASNLSAQIYKIKKVKFDGQRSN